MCFVLHNGTISAQRFVYFSQASRQPSRQAYELATNTHTHTHTHTTQPTTIDISCDMDTILRLMIHIQTRSALSRAPFTIPTFDKLYLTMHNDDIIIVVMISNTRYLYILNTYCHCILVNMKISQMFIACDLDRVSSTSNTQRWIQYSKHFSLVFTHLLLAAYFLTLLLFLILVNCNQ